MRLKKTARNTQKIVKRFIGVKKTEKNRINRKFRDKKDTNKEI